jgi:hypothetical protein
MKKKKNDNRPEFKKILSLIFQGYAFFGWYDDKKKAEHHLNALKSLEFKCEMIFAGKENIYIILYLPEKK